MLNEELLLEIAARACVEMLQVNSQALAEDVAKRMSTALSADLFQVTPSARTTELRDGTVLISESKTQTDTLEALLAASSALTPNCGLMVLRGVLATGWNCIGFPADNFKRAMLDCSKGVAAQVIGACAGMVAKATEFDAAFTTRLGIDGSADVLLIPVQLKGRVAAVLIAVLMQQDDLPALDLLVRVAQLSLDLQVYRKTPPQPAAEPPRPPAEPARAAAAASSYPPSAAHTAAPVAESRARELPHTPAPQSSYVAPSTAQPAHASAASYSSVSAAAPASHPPAAQPRAPQYPAAPVQSSPTAPPPRLNFSQPPVAAAPDEAHDKARRFAKLLVEEIKLYNQAKVMEGRAHGDLYNRLHEDIEKSRVAYQKRYGESVRDVDYFTQELLRILADNNRAVMGPDFPS